MGKTVCVVDFSELMSAVFSFEEEKPKEESAESSGNVLMIPDQGRQLEKTRPCLDSSPNLSES